MMQNIVIIDSNFREIEKYSVLEKEDEILLYIGENNSKHYDLDNSKKIYFFDGEETKEIKFASFTMYKTSLHSTNACTVRELKNLYVDHYKIENGKVLINFFSEERDLMCETPLSSVNDKSLVVMNHQGKYIVKTVKDSYAFALPISKA